MANGAVSPGTQLQMQGAKRMEFGLAQITSAGQDPTTKQAAFQNAQQMGAMAAETIRQRFYKKEFEMVQQVHFQPVLDGMSADKAMLDNKLQTTTMAVQRFKSPQEQLTEEMEGAQVVKAEMPQPPPVKTADGKAAALALEPTPILNPEGGVHTEELLALIDPMDNKPVALSSARGISIMQDAHMEYGQSHTAALQQLMSIAAKYGGNSYMDRYAEGLMDSVIKQGNVATTGMTDPAKAQEWMEQRQQFETDQESAQIQQEGMGFEQDRQEGRLAADVQEAGALAQTDPKFASFLGDTTDPHQASAALQNYKSNLEKGLLQGRRAAQQGYTQIPAQMVSKPETWAAGTLHGDTVKRSYYTADVKDRAGTYGSEVRAKLFSDDSNVSSDMENLLRQHGASQQSIFTFKGDPSSNLDPAIEPDMQTALESIVELDKGFTKQANANANIRRIEDIAAYQDDVSAEVEGRVESLLQAKGVAPGTYAYEMDMAKKFEHFYKNVYGIKVGYRSPATAQLMDTIQRKYERGRYKPYVPQVSRASGASGTPMATLGWTPPRPGTTRRKSYRSPPQSMMERGRRTPASVQAPSTPIRSETGTTGSMNKLDILANDREFSAIDGEAESTIGESSNITGESKQHYMDEFRRAARAQRGS